MKTFTNSVKYRNPQTNDFETLPGLVGPGGGVHVGAKEPTNTNVNVWVTTEKENYYEIPEINDEIVSSEDTWSSEKISGEINAVGNGVELLTENLSSTSSVIIPGDISQYNRLHVYATYENASNRVQLLTFDRNSRANALVYQMYISSTTYIIISVSLDWNTKTLNFNYVVTSTNWTNTIPLVIQSIVAYE